MIHVIGPIAFRLKRKKNHEAHSQAEETHSFRKSETQDGIRAKENNFLSISTIRPKNI